MNRFFKNISVTVVSNLASFVVSGLITLVIPKFIGVEEYGLFQLYLFYLTYTGFFHFGWADGIYLRLGGSYYDKLDKSLIKGQFRAYFFMELLISVAFVLFALLYPFNGDKTFVFVCLGVSIILTLPKTFLQYLLQSTNRIVEFSRLILIEKLTFGLLSCLFIVFGSNSFQLLIVSDLVGKLLSLVYALYQCRDIIYHKPCTRKETLEEARACISAGIKLMFSNICSMLILGIVRWSIENQWGVETFGKVSLTIAFSNFLLIFVMSVSQVLYPSLRRQSSQNQFKIYDILRTSIMVPLLGMLILYYPISLFLNFWLPAYADSIKYMSVLFPLCVFQSKNSLLIETYLKTLRRETQLFIINLVTVALSLISTIVVVYLFHNLDAAMLSILVLFAFKSIFGEIVLSKCSGLKVSRDILLEVILCGMFVLLNTFMDLWVAVCVYIICYVAYVAFKHKDINNVICFIRERR